MASAVAWPGPPTPLQAHSEDKARCAASETGCCNQPSIPKPEHDFSAVIRTNVTETGCLEDAQAIASNLFYGLIAGYSADSQKKQA